MKRGLLLLAALVLLSQCVTAQADTDTASAANGRIRTQLVANDDVVLSSEIAARIASISLKGGDAFRKGQLLVAFDCDLYHAQQRKAEATATGAEKVLQVTERLAQLHSAGELDVEQARAKAQAAAADAAYMRTMVSGCRILAPFSGRVAKREAAPYEYVTAGKPLLEILNTEKMEVQLIVPSPWLKWLKVGTPFQVHIDDLDIDVPAKVSRIGAKVDPVSRTLTLVGRVEGKHPKLLPGMSGWARFPQHP